MNAHSSARYKKHPDNLSRLSVLTRHLIITTTTEAVSFKAKLTSEEIIMSEHYFEGDQYFIPRLEAVDDASKRSRVENCLTRTGPLFAVIGFLKLFKKSAIKQFENNNE